MFTVWGRFLGDQSRWTGINETFQNGRAFPLWERDYICCFNRHNQIVYIVVSACLMSLLRFQGFLSRDVKPYDEYGNQPDMREILNMSFNLCSTQWKIIHLQIKTVFTKLIRKFWFMYRSVIENSAMVTTVTTKYYIFLHRNYY